VPNEDEAVSASSRSVQEARHRGEDRDEGHVGERSRRRVTIEMQGADGKAESLTIEKLLVATGRGPVTDGWAPRKRDSSSIAALSWWTICFARTSPAFSAIGDVITMGKTPHPQLAHLSSAEGHLLAERIAGQDVRRSTTTRCPAARTASRRSAASA
jgi:pyruvate/2-oxoglutarate dehydrogenase complex dihydrolipoamide dehydrogenase (E3) component